MGSCDLKSAYAQVTEQPRFLIIMAPFGGLTTEDIGESHSWELRVNDSWQQPRCTVGDKTNLTVVDKDKPLGASRL